MKFNKFLLLCFVSSIQKTNPVVIANGNSTTANTTFTTALVSSAFHRPSQTWFVGLTNGAGSYALSKVTHDWFNQEPTFAAIGSNAAVTGKYIGNLSLSQSATLPTQPYLVFTAEDDATVSSTTFKVVDYAGTSYAASAAIKDENGDTTGEILGLVATPTHVIVAVKDNGQIDNNFGEDAHDGLALVRINRATTPTFTYYDASNGTTNTPKAVNVDATEASAIFGITANSVPGPFFDMVYNDDLKRLYVSAQMTGANVNENDRAFGVAIFKVDPDNNTLTKLNQCANQAMSMNDNTRIVGFKGQQDVVALRKLAVMKTSTGFYYLIVNGSGSTDANTRNEVYAVPLVSGNGTDIDGTLARANTFDTVSHFNVQASAAAHLATKTTASALVGGGVLPIVANDADIYVSDMHVVGDAVYCAITSDTVNATNAPGVYYSQAVFNDLGKIARWTDWAKAAPFSLGNSATDGSTKKIAIDATTGDIWGVTISGTVVKKTEWTTTGAGTTSLVAQLNSLLSSGCFSFYDLNQSTVNFGDTSTAARRYAYFGGAAGKVVFVKTSTSATNAFLGVQSETSDFTAATAYLVTQITNETAPVTALGYSKGAGGGTNGYFLAGTKNGLYAWALTANGAGFDPANYADLNAAPFDTTTYSWQKITAISGEVKQIKSTKNQIYVLTRDLDRNNTAVVDRVYRIGIAEDIADLIFNTVLIASSGTGLGTASDLSTATLFFDIFPMPSAADNSTDKLLLATNDGLYRSAAAVNADTTQTEATWTQVTNPATDENVYDFLTGPTHNRYESTVWASHWADDALGLQTYTRSSWRQINSSDIVTLADMPNAQFCTDGSTITDVVPTKYFWSDGARRFFIGIPASSDGRQNNIYALPYRVGTADWNINTEPGLEADNALETQDRFYWISNIGATGAIFAGSNKGVVALQ